MKLDIASLIEPLWQIGFTANFATASTREIDPKPDLALNNCTSNETLKVTLAHL